MDVSKASERTYTQYFVADRPNKYEERAHRRKILQVKILDIVFKQ